MSDYKPIDCGLYERYELAIMHRQVLLTCWRGPDGLARLECLKPFDLRVRDGVEFLHALTLTGEERVLRLDSITRAKPAS